MGNLKNVIGLAKNGKRKPGRPPKIKPGSEPKNINDLLKDDSHNKEEKAKKAVEILLKDSSIDDVLKNDKLLELDADIDSTISEESYKWLEDQIVALTVENDNLKKEIENLNNSTPEGIENEIVKLFVEMQDNYLKRLHLERSTGNPTKVNVLYMLKYFDEHFPFIKKYRKF